MKAILDGVVSALFVVSSHLQVLGMLKYTRPDTDQQHRKVCSLSVIPGGARG